MKDQQVLFPAPASVSGNYHSTFSEFQIPHINDIREYSLSLIYLTYYILPYIHPSCCKWQNFMMTEEYSDVEIYRYVYSFMHSFAKVQIVSLSWLQMNDATENMAMNMLLQDADLNSFEYISRSGIASIVTAPPSLSSLCFFPSQ